MNVMNDRELKLVIGILMAFFGSMMGVAGVGGLVVSFLGAGFPGFRLLCSIQIPVGLGIALLGGMMIRAVRTKG